MYKKISDGTIEVITGPMFSGKSDELIKRIRTLSYANVKTLAVKPRIDSRFSTNEIVSRAGTKIPTYVVETVADIKSLFEKSKYKAIAIDEAQFFDKDLVPYVEELANQGIRVIICGLDQDYLRRPFGVMPSLLAMAEHITKLQAICVICKNAASTTFRTIKSNKLKVIGDLDEYEARCRICHNKGLNNLEKN